MGPVHLKYTQIIHDLLRESGIIFIEGPMSSAIKASSLFKVIKDVNKRTAEAVAETEITFRDIYYIKDKSASLSRYCAYRNEY
ncbi:MAG: hypothetical protein A4E49_00813 [Methanosaeta sp. PtaU1.Bin112]|nr:MAG: hypothetical protein A4E49_00813 [Methanosaeta sp. PtaU1.Bin112]